MAHPEVRLQLRFEVLQGLPRTISIALCANIMIRRIQFRHLETWIMHDCKEKQTGGPSSVSYVRTSIRYVQDAGPSTLHGRASNKSR